MRFLTLSHYETEKMQLYKLSLKIHLEQRFLYFLMADLGN